MREPPYWGIRKIPGVDSQTAASFKQQHPSKLLQGLTSIITENSAALSERGNASHVFEFQLLKLALALPDYGGLILGKIDDRRWLMSPRTGIYKKVHQV